MDAAGHTADVVVERGTRDAERDLEQVIRTWTWWPAYRDGVAVADEQQVEFMSR